MTIEKLTNVILGVLTILHAMTREIAAGDCDTQPNLEKLAEIIENQILEIENMQKGSIN